MKLTSLLNLLSGHPSSMFLGWEDGHVSTLWPLLYASSFQIPTFRNSVHVCVWPQSPSLFISPCIEGLQTYSSRSKHKDSHRAKPFPGKFALLALHSFRAIASLRHNLAIHVLLKARRKRNDVNSSQCNPPHLPGEFN